MTACMICQTAHALALAANDFESDEDLGHALFKIARAVSAVGDEVHQTPAT